MSSQPPTHLPYVQPLDTRQRVIVTDVDMPFGSMVVFIIKWTIASIPALILLWLIFIAVFVVLGLIFGSVFHGMSHGVSPWHY
jgi:hypothetical protein